VNGVDMGVVNPYTPFVRISSQVVPGESLDVAIFTEQSYSEPGGIVFLLEGTSATNWWIGGGGESDFVSAAAEALSQGRPTSFPVHLAAGGVNWIFGRLPDLQTCQTLTVAGQHVKITAFFNERIVGRLWLPSGDLRPEMKGGMADNRVYLPGPWFQKTDNRLAFYVEAVGEQAEIAEMMIERADI
jgi:beta-galactosidase